ncbi:hypothetical protein HaLaN_06923, partial [Haematococcus lacustris]
MAGALEGCHHKDGESLSQPAAEQAIGRSRALSVVSAPPTPLKSDSALMGALEQHEQATSKPLHKLATNSTATHSTATAL